MSEKKYVLVQIDPDTLAEAEPILNEIGIPVSEAINMFLKQVRYHNGIPFEIKIPEYIRTGKDTEACH